MNKREVDTFSAPVDPKFLHSENPHIDARGTFGRLFDFSTIPDIFETKQVNFSVSISAGTVRGMHLLRGPHSETKIVKVVKGKIFDIAVNLDKKSTSFDKIFTYELTPDSPPILIPPLHAHGFQTLESDTWVVYCVNQIYTKHADTGISPLSPRLINLWPLEISQISERDRSLDIDISGDVSQCICS